MDKAGCVFIGNKYELLWDIGSPAAQILLGRDGKETEEVEVEMVAVRNSC